MKVLWEYCWCLSKWRGEERRSLIIWLPHLAFLLEHFSVCVSSPGQISCCICLELVLVFFEEEGYNQQMICCNVWAGEEAFSTSAFDGAPQHRKEWKRRPCSDKRRQWPPATDPRLRRLCAWSLSSGLCSATQLWLFFKPLDKSIIHVPGCKAEHCTTHCYEARLGSSPWATRKSCQQCWAV